MPEAPPGFPPPWPVDDPDMKLGQDCYIVRDTGAQALSYIAIWRPEGIQRADFCKRSSSSFRRA